MIVKTIILIIAFHNLEEIPQKHYNNKIWEYFKLHYNKQYKTPKEEKFRQGLFLKKINYIEEHNQKFASGQVSYKVGINKFADFTKDELYSYTHGLRCEIPPNQFYGKETFRPSDHFEIPLSKDWRDGDIVLFVKNQGSCGSCWAFSTTGVLESHYALYKNQTVSLSEQQLVDCVDDNHGCHGGWMSTAFAYIAKTGINAEMDYPYEKTDGRSCRFNSNNSCSTLTQVLEIETGNEEHLLAAVAEKGPVSVAVDASGDFASYQSGIYYNADCSTTILTHAVVVVGFGSENGEDYWVVKNSYGSKWGEEGYIKMARKRNHCGIANVASFPVVV